MFAVLKAFGWKLLPGFVVASLLFGGAIAWEHRRDHEYLHALIALEQRRQQMLREQQDAQAKALQGKVMTPEKPPVASSPVPEPGKK